MTDTTNIAISQVHQIELRTPRGFVQQLTRQLVRLFSADGRFALPGRSAK